MLKKKLHSLFTAADEGTPGSDRTDCQVTDSPNEYRYQYVWPQIPTGVNSFTFSVRANNDAHISLSSTSADVANMYEIGKFIYLFLCTSHSKSGML
jgi:hypothetical protein